MHEKIDLITFDIFGTVLDWRRGLTETLAAAGVTLRREDFDRIIDVQGELEQRGPFTSYREITARSLVQVLALAPSDADAIGEAAGRWPLFDDARESMQRLMEIAPCAAMSNSDLAHGRDVQRTLGFDLSDWICAEEARVYKPSVAFWNVVSRRKNLPFGPSWWHVSAYGDYDLDVARRLGLTCVFVERPHHRPGPADHRVHDLSELAATLRSA
jgi:2-haloacid dehalogenase